MSVKNLMLVDGSGYIFRAYYALPPLSNPTNVPVNAVYGFCRMLIRLVKDSDADGIFVVFDTKEKTFRNALYADYKANRKAPPEDLIPQFPLMREAVAAFNMAQCEYEGFEADDVIASWAKKAKAEGAKVTIVTSDKDMMQLMETGIDVFDPIKKKYLSLEDVVTRFGVSPEKVVEVQALAGDSSDNIPGVPGIGVKTAAQLVAQFGDLEGLLGSVDQIKQPKRREALKEHANLARISRELATLKNDIPLQETLESAAKRAIDPKKLKQFLQDQGFSSLLREYGFDETSHSYGSGESKLDYTLIQSEETLHDWICKIEKHGFVALDTETDSLEVTRARLVGISLAVQVGEACYIPLAHRNETILEVSPKQLALESVLAALKPVLESDAILKIGHNFKYDHALLMRYGIDVVPCDDTMLMSFCLDGGKNRHNMDELCNKHFDHSCLSFQEVTGKGKTQKTFDLVDVETACRYAAEDADMTLRLWQLFRHRLGREGRKQIYEMVERPLIRVISEMERRGVKIDRAMLRELSVNFSERIAALEEKIFVLSGEQFNIASARQLGVVLFEKMGLKSPSKTATGQYSTSSDVLEPLQKDHEIICHILDWRHLSKLRSTYTDSLENAIHPETGRVHTHFVMTGVRTGRFASTHPNLQNIPIRTEEGRAIRKAFRAEEGYKLVSIDYSQIELRLAVHIAGVDSLGAAIMKGGDIHAHTASEVFSIPLSDITPELRRRAKAVNFGILYGISAFGLARQLNCPQAEALSYMQAYLERYRGIATYMEKIKAFCKEKGYVETLFGRVVHIPSIHDKNPIRRRSAERQAINAPIQGTAADIIKRAMARIAQGCAQGEIKASMLLQVHDELLFEIHESDLEATAGKLSRIMTQSDQPLLKLKVPLEVKVGVGTDWDQAH